MADHAVLLISEHPEAASGMAQAVKEAGLRLHTCADAKAAEQRLHDDERIVVIVGDMPDSAAHAQAAALLQEFRTHVAWSRLPALVLLPEALMRAIQRVQARLRST